MRDWIWRRLAFFQLWLEEKNIPSKWLFNKLYPDYHKPLTEDQSKELIEAFKGWNIDMKKAIIVDIDGTLAKMQDRGPFEWTRVGEDKVNEPVKLVVNLLKKTHHVIIFSGRDGSCLTETINWLNENRIHYDKIFMRPAGNFEKDSIIKRRMYDEHVKDKYEVAFVLDDRNQVVDMWRKDLGLTCFQVDYGDF